MLRQKIQGGRHPVAVHVRRARRIPEYKRWTRAAPSGVLHLAFCPQSATGRGLPKDPARARSWLMKVVDTECEHKHLRVPNLIDNHVRVDTMRTAR